MNKLFYRIARRNVNDLKKQRKLLKEFQLIYRMDNPYGLKFSRSGDREKYEPIYYLREDDIKCQLEKAIKKAWYYRSQKKQSLN